MGLHEAGAPRCPPGRDAARLWTADCTYTCFSSHLVHNKRDVSSGNAAKSQSFAAQFRPITCLHEVSNLNFSRFVYILEYGHGLKRVRKTQMPTLCAPRRATCSNAIDARYLHNHDASSIPHRLPPLLSFYPFLPSSRIPSIPFQPIYAVPLEFGPPAPNSAALHRGVK